jgi:dihydroxy-acid dehydratase
MTKDESNLKLRSRNLFEGIGRTPFKYGKLELLKAVGMNDDDIENKPFIGIVNTWNELNPGHRHLRNLAESVKYGVIEAGGVPLEFCTIGACDGWAMGTVGMRSILPHREVIVDSIELMVNAHQLDGMVTLSSCDKINPAILMAAIRLDIPTICVPGGPNMYEVRFMPEYKGIVPDNYNEPTHIFGCITCATYGACEGMGTANTTQCLMEAFGMTLPNAATIPAQTLMKEKVAKNSGRAIIELLKKGIKPSQIMTKKSLENAIIVDLAIGGSTNSTLHLPAIAHEMGIDFDIEIFNIYTKKVPTIVNVSPSGDYGTADLFKAGGVPAVLNRIKKFLHLDCLTVSGKTIGESIRKAKVLDNNIIKPIKDPVFPEGGTVILKGNLAPEGAVVKQSAIKNKEMLNFKGPALCFNSEQDVTDALTSNQVQNGSVLIIRNEGPKGGPGMPELLAVTMTLVRKRELDRVALITDGRFSGYTSGPCIGHVSPEAYVGGPISIIENGDLVQIDIPNRTLNVDLSDIEIQKRLKNWKPFEKNIKSKALLKYRSLVSSAVKGAVLKF